MPFVEDLSAFFQNADFATSAYYDGTRTIQVIFDQPDLTQNMVAGTNPTALCNADDVDADPTGKTLVIDSVTYTIRDFQPQDDGSVVQLQLSENG